MDLNSSTSFLMRASEDIYPVVLPFLSLLLTLSRQAQYSPDYEPKQQRKARGADRKEKKGDREENQQQKPNPGRRDFELGKVKCLRRKIKPSH